MMFYFHDEININSRIYKLLSVIKREKRMHEVMKLPWLRFLERHVS